MKPGIHPEYPTVAVHCACGHTWTTRSTKGQELRLEICSNCHPFFTGKQRLLDTAGRVDRFTKKFGSKDALETKRLQEAAVAAAAKKAAAEKDAKARVKAAETKAKEKESKAKEREARAAAKAKDAAAAAAAAPAAEPKAEKPAESQA